MERITLKNFKELDSIKEEHVRPNSIEDVLKDRLIRESIKDNGITNFKEISDMNKISFGHFILLEKILSHESLDTDARVKMASPIILRPLNELKLDNENLVKEKEHVDKVLDENIGNIFGAFNRYMELRKEYLYKTYNGVIYATIDADDDENDDKEDEEEGTNTNSSQSARDFHTKKFFWNSMISDVANGDIFRFDDVVELMMFIVMPYLAEKRSLGIVEYLEHKANLQ